MSEDFTPTTKDVRDGYALDADGQHDWSTKWSYPEFDRWLAAHDSEIRTAALEEALTIARVAARLNSSWSGRPHPVAVSIAAAIHAIAETETP